MITDEDPLRGLLFYWNLGFSHTLHVLKERIPSLLKESRPTARVLGATRGQPGVAARDAGRGGGALGGWSMSLPLPLPPQ